MHRNLRLLPALALPGIALAVLVGPGASAQDTGTRIVSLKELDKGSKFRHVRNTKGAPSTSNMQGDVIAFINPLVDPAGQSVGTLHVSCVTTVGARDFMKSAINCSGALVLRDGMMTLQTVVTFSDTTTGAITGGTGAYANARGTFVSKQVSGGSQDTITLVG